MNFGNLSGLVNGTEQVVFDYEVPFGTNVIGGGTASASSDNGNVPANAFGAYNINTYWRSLTESPNGAWIKYDFGAGVTKTIRALKLNSDFNQSYKFGPFNFQGSNNNSDWTTVASLVDAVTANEPLGDKTLSFANSTAYRYYRLIGTGANPSGTGTVIYNTIQMSESGPETSISTGNILNGDEDGWYTIIVRHVNGATGAALGVQFNADTGTSYGYRGINSYSTTVEDWAGTGATSCRIEPTSPASGICQFSISRVYAKSGSVRLVSTLSTGGLTGTTVNTISSSGSVWNNTADNIVSAQFTTGQANGFGIGSRIIILKPNNFTNGTPTGVINTPYIQGSWVRLPGSGVVASDTTSVTITADGDRDVLYMISAEIVNNSGSNPSYFFRPNNVSTNTVYGYQYFQGASTTVNADRATTGITGIDFAYANNGTVTRSNVLLFAKSGFIRPALISRSNTISGTTVTNVACFGFSWNNTADNITSLVITADAAGGITAGSQIDVYALRPNG
jgi:hypothetical protein